MEIVRSFAFIFLTEMGNHVFHFHEAEIMRSFAFSFMLRYEQCKKVQKTHLYSVMSKKWAAANEISELAAKQSIMESAGGLHALENMVGAAGGPVMAPVTDGDSAVGNDGGPAPSSSSSSSGFFGPPAAPPKEKKDKKQQKKKKQELYIQETRNFDDEQEDMMFGEVSEHARRG